MQSQEPWAHLRAGPGITAESMCPWASRLFPLQPLVSHLCQLLRVLHRLAQDSAFTLSSIALPSGKHSAGPPLQFTISPLPASLLCPCKMHSPFLASPSPLHSHNHRDCLPFVYLWLPSRLKSLSRAYMCLVSRMQIPNMFPIYTETPKGHGKIFALKAGGVGCSTWI